MLSGAVGYQVQDEQGLGASPAPAASAGHVLIVEDDRGMLELYSDILLEHGFRIAAACDGHAAARLLGTGDFDAVLTDVYMPEAGGLELLRSVRERDVDLPVVLVTGSPSLETAVQAIEMGALHYLMKPVSTEELLRCVEDAVARHRSAVQRRRVVEPAGSPVAAADRAALEVLFDRAMASVYMTYQPIIRTRDGSVFGWEALLRTREPAVAGPLAFIGMAEQLGRVRELSRSIRSLVCRAAKHARGRVFFVNLHPDDLLDDDLFDPAAPLSVLASDIVLEITERSPLDDVPDIKDRVRRLRALGFRVAIDDLGSGYSGLTSIATLEPEFVKLDRSLLSGMDGELTKRRLVGSIASLGRDMGISVVAEGVETDAERRAAAELGCDLMQGFFFRRPEELRFEEDFPLAVNV
jgi:EAL domain-containing protein (putative c-di-GMP-specific phosphodiesterase class I)